MALEFEGTATYINLGPAAIPDITDHTITCWCNASNLSSTGSNKSLVNLDEITSPNSGINLYLKGADDATAGRLGCVVNGFQFTADVKVTLNNWHLAAIRGHKSNGSVISILGSWESENTAPSHTSTPSGFNRMLVLFVGNETSVDSQAVSSVTYGGQSMTFENFIEVDDSLNARVELWTLNEAGITASVGTSFTIIFPGAGDVGYSHAFFQNVNQANPIGNISTNTGVLSGPTISTSSSISSSANEIIIACTVQGDDGTFTPNNGFIEGTDQLHAGFDGSASHTAIYKVSTGAAETPSTTSSVTNPRRHVILGAQLNQAAPSPGGTADVSIDGGIWTALSVGSAGDTNNFKIFTTDDQNLARWSGNSLYFSGKLADARVYGRQLTQNEITTIYSARGQDGIVDGLLGRWPLLDAPIGITPGNAASSYVDSSETMVANATSIDVTIPNNVDGDLLVAFICAGGPSGGNAVNVITPIGWVKMDSGDTDLPGSPPSRPSLWAYYKTASSDSGTQNFTLDNISISCAIIGHMLSYRHIANHVPANVSSLNTDQNASPVSPLISGSSSVLVLRVCATDGENTLTTPESDFYPVLVTERQATESISGVGNGCTLGTGDELAVTSVPTRTWSSAASQEWGCLTITWLVQTAVASVYDISGASGAPNNGTVQAYPIQSDSELRY